MKNRLFRSPQGSGHQERYLGLVLVSTGVLKFGKPSAASGTASSTWKLNLNADENYALAA